MNTKSIDKSYQHTTYNVRCPTVEHATASRESALRLAHELADKLNVLVTITTYVNGVSTRAVITIDPKGTK